MTKVQSQDQKHCDQYAHVTIILPDLERTTMLEDMKKQFASVDAYVSMALGLAIVLVAGTMVYNLVVKKPGGSVPQTANNQTAQNQATAPGETEGTALTGSLPAKHEVKSGETLWVISEKYYKSGYNWVDIRTANKLANADVITAGTVLTIPNVKPILPTGQVSATSVDTTVNSYTVKAGDSLWNIAREMYGDGYKWSEIAKNNSLVNPNIIHPGNVLKIPRS